ncbi:sulfur oxidation c-type cytochrome SoxX [Chelatococcus sp. GCM10030263]|uniref:sulfur oxidation c-type cytochrome SoxX n=1 Tax=Chelatococcus sp. GCM10030263 TaxID=3273387 RepID=UPI0036216230
MLLALAGAPAAMAEEPLRTYAVTGDAIRLSLTGRPGDAERGRSLVMDRHKSLCLLCHSGPFPEPHAQGTLAPSLAGVGGRLSEGQIRLRVVDMKRLDPDSIMPAYYRVDGGERVGEAWRGRPVLAADEIEDIVAFLVTLKE